MLAYVVYVSYSRCYNVITKAVRISLTVCRLRSGWIVAGDWPVRYLRLNRFHEEEWSLGKVKRAGYKRK